MQEKKFPICPVFPKYFNQFLDKNKKKPPEAQGVVLRAVLLHNMLFFREWYTFL